MTRPSCAARCYDFPDTLPHLDGLFLTTPSGMEAPGFSHGEEMPPCPSEDKIFSGSRFNACSFGYNKSAQRHSSETTVLGISEDSTVAETHAFFLRKVFGRFCFSVFGLTQKWPPRERYGTGLTVSKPMDGARQGCSKRLNLSRLSKPLALATGLLTSPCALAQGWQISATGSPDTTGSSSGSTAPSRTPPTFSNSPYAETSA